MPDMPEPTVTPDELQDALSEALDHELSRLPEKYRIVIVLCELRGLTLKETASQLSWPIGTVSSRLSRAKSMLAKRLAGRGVMSGSVIPPLMLPGTGVPPVLLRSTVRSSLGFATRNLLAPAEASASATSLATEVLKVMSLTKVSYIASASLACALVFSGPILARQLAGKDPEAILNPARKAELAPAEQRASPPIDEIRSHEKDNQVLNSEHKKFLKMQAELVVRRDALEREQKTLDGKKVGLGKQRQLFDEQREKLLNLKKDLETRSGKVMELTGETPREILDELEQDRRRLELDLKAARTPGEASALQARWQEKFEAVVRRGVSAAKARPADADSIGLLFQLIAMNLSLEDEVRVRDVLYTAFVTNPRLAEDFDELAASSHDPNWAHAIEWLASASELNPSGDVRRRALFFLGKVHKEMAEFASYVGRCFREAQEGQLLCNILGGPESVRKLMATGEKEFKRRAEDCFTKVITNVGTPADGTTRDLVEQAERQLYEIRHLAVGMLAPEIEGEDLDGHTLKLSNYRGKVTAISFWATWCGPCMAMVPEERSLVEKYRGRQFALLGVNGDDDTSKALRVSKEQKMIWPSWHNAGGRKGAISSRWNITGWPTVYILDPRGVIRWKRPSFPHAETMEIVVDELMRESQPGS